MNINKPRKFNLSPKSKKNAPTFFEGLNLIAQWIKLSLYMFITSLPIITIGAALTAGHRLCFDLIAEDEDVTLSAYLQVYKENLKKSTLLWLILFGLGALLLLDLWLIPNLLGQSAATTIARYLFAVLLLLVAMTYLYTFALQALIENTTLLTLRNALYLSIRFLPYTALLAIVYSAPIAFYIFLPWLAIRLIPLFILLIPGLVIYLCTVVLNKVFTHFDLTSVNH